MTDWKSLATGPRENPAETAEREARHQVLIELLGAYADRELPPETTSQIDAHLIGCARCRRELAVHQAMSRRLSIAPPVAAPPELRERIKAAIAAMPMPPVAPELPAPLHRPRTSRRVSALLLALSIVLVGAAVGIRIATRSDVVAESLGRLGTPAAEVPLLQGVLTDYRRVTAGDLPGRARDLDVVRSAVPFPVEPLRAPGVRLVAAWTTEIQGEPAAVLAYCWDDRIVVQYLLNDDQFFQHPAIRGAVSDGRLFATTDGAQSILAWPTNAAGSVLVGDVSPERLARWPAGELLARTVRRGAQ